MRRKNKTVMLTLNGKTQTIDDWSREKGAVSSPLIRYRLGRGWDVEKAIYQPPMSPTAAGRRSRRSPANINWSAL